MGTLSVRRAVSLGIILGVALVLFSAQTIWSQPVQVTLAVSDSVAASGSVTTPAGGNAIVTIAAASLPAGTYSVTVFVGYEGVLAALERLNMRLQKGATALWTLPVNAVASSNVSQYGPFLVSLDGSTTLSVNAIVGGTVGAIYDAGILATRGR